MTMTDRIAEVLQLHGDSCTRANADYLAEKVAELFIEEWKMCHESGGGSIHRSYESARECFDSFVERPPGVEDPGSGKYTHIAHRWVSEWTKT